MGFRNQISSLPRGIFFFAVFAIFLIPAVTALAVPQYVPPANLQTFNEGHSPLLPQMSIHSGIAHGGYTSDEAPTDCNECMEKYCLSLESTPECHAFRISGSGVNNGGTDATK